MSAESDLDQKLRQVFAAELAIEPNVVVDDLKYGQIPAWDSIAHMALIAAIEEAFDIMIDADDVIDMSSFGAAKRIVSKHL